MISLIEKNKSLNNKLLSKERSRLSKRYESFDENNAYNFIYVEILSIFISI